MMKKIVIMIFSTIMVLNLVAQNGLETIEHRVEKGQTLYFLSKKYDTSIQDLMRFNPQIGKDMIIKDGMILKIFTKPMEKIESKNYRYHTVEKGQTLYSLSKMYNVSVDDIIYMNQLDNPSIGIGDKLIVQNVNNEALYNVSKNNDSAKENIPNDNSKNISISSKKENDKLLYKQVETVKTEGKALEIKSKDVEMYKMLYDSYAETGSALKKKKGIGNFLEQSTTKDVYLALVDGIVSGQVIRLRNLMNNKVIYLKVIGSVPSKDQKNNIAIKISQAAARDLKIVEDRFLAEWTWFEKKEKKSTNTNKSIRITDF